MWSNNRYQVCLADTKEARQLHYQLRYKVFCAEKGWEKNIAPDSRVEFDEYDECSIHFLARDRLTGEWVAGVRLVVLPYPSLPVAKLCPFSDLLLDNIETDRCVEVSRLFVLPESRFGSGVMKNDLKAKSGPRSEGEVILSLIWAARAYVLNRRLHGWFMLVQPSFERKLRRLGLDFSVCGSGVEFHGWRKPYYGDVFDSFGVLADKVDALVRLVGASPAYYLYSSLVGSADESHAYLERVSSGTRVYATV